MPTLKLKEQNTYIFIDASNIRSACLKTCGFRIDFRELGKYFRQKYPKLVDMRYYEGIAKDDIKRKRAHRALHRAGYTVCPLERKSYIVPAECMPVKCEECGHESFVTIHGETTTVKSNVDVYLATDMIFTAVESKDKPIHIILVSCDGDYAETIKSILEKYNRAHLTVLATPYLKGSGSNTLSSRIKSLRNFSDRFFLRNIENIRPKIEASNKHDKLHQNRGGAE